SVGLYVFVSSISVYGDFSRPVDEDSPAATMPDETVEEITGETYGPFKALSERAAERAMPGRTLVVRPGLIVGPHDPTVRFSYWTARVARGGEVLAPGRPGKQVQFIDARDLSDWIVRMAEERRTGVFNATGPERKLTMGEFLEECRAVSGSDASFTWVGEDFLLERGVGEWGEMPLWLSDANQQSRYHNSVSIEKALAAGLTFLPLAETIRDTLAWLREGARPPAKDGVHTPDLTLRPERERELLAEWHEKTG
ncbi:MAG TPA: NAD-dependent epimerase/dehydratase family protein, partial [Pyrinomonadaceae bacterium]|nr:NAD-dependent epimerase/dehydratase family protein [Pyrinomonadaceae bacterium]